MSNQVKVLRDLLRSRSANIGGDLEIGCAGNENIKPTGKSLGEAATLRAMLDGISKKVPFVNVMDFGAKGDGVTDDITAITNAILYLVSLGGGILLFPAGRYYISARITLYSNISVLGVGIGATIIDLKTNYDTKAFVTATPTITTLTQTSDINIGDLTNTLTSPGALSAGHLLYYENSRRFTLEWDGGAAIPGRAYYTNKETFRVKSVSGTAITFDEAAALYQPVSTAVACSYFTPNKNIHISNLTIQRDADSDDTRASSMGISLEYCDGASVSKVQSLRSNSAGIQLLFSHDISIKDVWTTGSSDSNSGTNYGISNIGSKHVSISRTWHRHHRHGLTAGTGTGLPIPMYQTASQVHVYDSMSSASLDTHGGSLGFHYDHCFGDWGLSISGIGHSVKNMYLEQGVFELYEGGTDHLFENIYFKKCNRHYSNNAVYRVRFVDCTFNFGAVGKGFSSRGLSPSSKFVEYTRCKFWNRGFMDQALANNAAADATITGSWTEPGTGGTTQTGDFNNSFGMQLYEGYQLIDCEIHGFPTGYRIIGPNCVVRNIRLTNCGWDSSIPSAAPGVFSLNSAATGSTVKGICVEFSKSGPTNAQNVFFFGTGGGGAQTNIIVEDVFYGANHTANYNQGVSLPLGFVNITLKNIVVPCTVADTLTPTTGCLYQNVNGLIYKYGTLININSSGQFATALRLLSTLQADGNVSIGAGGTTKVDINATTGAVGIVGDVTADAASVHRFRKAIAAAAYDKVLGAESTGRTNNPRLEVLLREDTKEVCLKMNGSAAPASIVIMDSSENILWRFTHAGALLAAGRLQTAKGADVVAANDLTLGAAGNKFKVTGNTQINGIASANWQAGSEVTLLFTGTPTVKHNTAASAGFASLLLNGSADLVAANNTCLTLWYDGTNWQEKCRKVA